MKQNASVDDIDRRILSELQEDASLSHVQLAERVGSSAASCWRRIKSLEAAGILGPAVRLLNAEKVNRGVNVFCNVRMRNYSKETVAVFEAFINARAEVMECYSMSGEWDYLLRVVVADVAGYEYFLMRILLEHPSVGSAASHFALSQKKYTTSLPV
jgi:Lrp/AsnC family transcriptional regulator